MAGLLEKDFRLIFKRKQGVLMLLLIAIMMGFSTDGTFIVGYLTCLCVIFTISTISYDELENGYPFLMTLPIDCKTYVREKYLFCFLVGIGFWSIGMILLFIIDFIKKIPVDPLEEFGGAVFMIPIFMIFAAFMIPLELKYGAEKSRLALAVLCGGIMAMVMIFNGFLIRGEVDVMEKLSYLNQIPGGILFGGLVILAIVIIGISLKVSEIIMIKKEY